MATQNFTAAVPTSFASGSAHEGLSGQPGRDELATYTLCYEDDRRGLEKRIHFEAATPAVALEIAQGEAGGRWALLLRDGKILCRLEREAVGLSEYWLIAGESSPPSDAACLQPGGSARAANRAVIASAMKAPD